MPSPKPKLGWRAVPGFSEPPYSDRQFESILAALREAQIEIADDAQVSLKEGLQEIGTWYRLASHQYGMPTSGQVRAALLELTCRAKSFADLLSMIDDVSIESLLQQQGMVHDLAKESPGGQFIADRVRAKAEWVKRIAEEAKAAATWVKGVAVNSDGTFDPKLTEFVKQPLRQNRTPIYLFISRIADVYQEFTGCEPTVSHNRETEKYSGSFFEFARSALLGNDQKRFHAGLGKTIQNVLKERAQALREN